MKKLILSCAFLFAFVAFVKGQELPVDSKTNKITYIEVVEAQGLTAKDLYKITRDWGKSKGLKPTENEAEGEIVFDGTLPIDYERTKGKIEKSKVTYKLSIFTKDGKYRYILTDLVHVGMIPSVTGGKLESPTPACSLSGINAANWTYIKKRTQSGVEAVIADLKRVVKEAENDPSKKKDW